MPLRVGLFAADEVGREIARVLADHGDRPACVVLDPDDRGACNDDIVRQAAVAPDRVLATGRAIDTDLLDCLRRLELDLVVLAWWPHVLPPDVIEVVRLGCLNLHPSLLPHNRGKDPNFWAIVEGAPGGVTIHHVDAGVDSGPVAFQVPLEIGWEDTGATVHARTRRALVTLFENAWPRIRTGDLPRHPQPGSGGPARRRRELEPASRLDLDRPCPPRELLNRLRARTFPPHPACWFEDGGERYEVHVTIRRVRAEARDDAR